MMQSYRMGEVVLLKFPFADQKEVKKRPALVLLDTDDADILVARITSQDMDTDYDVRLVEWRKAGLLLPSVVRMHKLATLQKTLVERQMGILTQKDMSNIQARLKQMWENQFR